MVYRRMYIWIVSRGAIWTIMTNIVVIDLRTERRLMFMSARFG